MRLILILLLLFAGQGALAAAAPGAPGQLEEPVKLLAYMAAGIGIFLVGIKYIGGHLQQMSGGTFKSMVSHISGNPVGVFLWGNSLGFFTQSGKASSFILAGFVQAGLLTVQRSLPMVYWCNAGASLIVVASVLPIKLIVMFLLGLTGLGITFHFPKKFFHAYGALFGIGMIMYGLFLLKTGAAGFIDYPWLPPLLEQMRGVFLLSLLLGVLLTLVAQSDMAVAMISIAMASSGLFALEESVMIVYGTQAGAALLTYGFSFNFRGRARQVVMAQVLFKAIVAALFVVLFFMEVLGGVPLLHAVARSITGEVGVQVAVVTLVMSFLGAVCVLLLNKSLGRFIERAYPPSVSEVLSEPEYLNKMAAESPETGLVLVEREQLNLMQRLPLYLDYVRADTADASKTHPSAYHEAFVTISAAISDVLSDISGRGLNEADSASLIRVTKLQELLVSLEDIVYRVVTRLEAHAEAGVAMQLGQRILESMDFMILAGLDAVRSREQDDIDTLAILTDDRSQMMDKVRRNYFQSEDKLSQAGRNFILDITILFENAALTLGRHAALLRS